ncbi:MAG: CatB-related O-acetyltransferase [Pseudomonadota bacterium]
MTHPDPARLHPLPKHPRVVNLQALAGDRPNVTVGSFAYYDDPDDPTAFFERNVLHHHEFMGDHLTIGPFCALATGVRIIMNGAAHALDGFTTFPFEIFGAAWAEGFDPGRYTDASRGDTVIGADVWIGTEAMIMPGLTIGPGAVIAARSVVTQDVPPYTVVAGNTARVVRPRFDPDTARALERIAWWDWPLEKITRNLTAVRGADLAALAAAQ